MKIFHPPEPPESANADYFTGEVTLARMRGANENPLIDVFRVAFQPSRTAWHTHTGPQMLFVTEGCCRVQVAGEPIREVPTGGVVRFEAGERHWHGASPDAPMVHLAVNIKTAAGETFTDWSDKVTDAQYAG